MADKQTISVKMDMTREIRDLLSDLEKMDEASKKQLKDEVQAISAWTGESIKARAFATAIFPKQAEIIQQTIRPNRDRVPNITIGGSGGRRASGGATAGELLIGNEFGAYPFTQAGGFPNGGRRFPYRSPREGRGNAGYWIFPALKDLQPAISRRWWDAADRIFKNWQKFG